jgi:acetylornithine aminotransferase/acetylornithine/N-succinyldiaminopimelate aminotransferase
MTTACALPNARRQSITFVSGDGCYIRDDAGRQYLDLVSGLGVNALGHNHPRITRAIQDQASRLLHTSALYGNEYQELLARELCRLSGLDRALFVNSGTEGTEAALKLTRHYHPERPHIIALQGSFHGRSRGGMSVTGQAKLRGPFEPFSQSVTFVPPNDEAVLEGEFARDVAAMIVEPILGEGGVIPLTDSYLQKARALCDAHGALLIVDECQTGLGRTGKVFGYEWAGIQPDIVMVAKPLAGGLPLGAVMFSGAVAVRFPASSHGSTFAGGPLACRVALEFLDEMQTLRPNITRTGESLRTELSLWGEVRGRGLMLAMELDRPGDPIVAAARDRGLLINCTQSTVLRFLPPYILTTMQAHEAATILGEAMRVVS